MAGSSAKSLCLVAGLVLALSVALAVGLQRMQSGSNATVVHHKPLAKGNNPSVDSDEEPDGSRPSGKRTREESNVQIKVLPGGQAYIRGGELKLIELTPELVARLEDDVLVTPDILYNIGHLTSVQVPTDGRATIPSSQTDRFVWLEIPGFQVVPDVIPAGAESVELRVGSPISPVEVRVIGSDGNPIHDAEVGLRKASQDEDYIEKNWLGRLEARYFQVVGTTNSEGVSAFSFFPQGVAFLWTRPGAGYGLITRDQVSLAKEVVLVAKVGFSSRGSVSDQYGKPLGGALVTFFRQGEMGMETVGEAYSEPDGSFSCENILVDPSGIVAVSYKEGYQVSMEFVYDPNPGQLVEISFRLEEAVQRSIRILYPDDSPANDCEIMLATNDFDWIPFSYDLDKDGKCMTEKILSPTRQYFFDIWRQDHYLGRGILHEGQEGSLQASMSWLGSLNVKLSSKASWSKFKFSALDGGYEFDWNGEDKFPFVPAGEYQVDWIGDHGEVLRTESVDIPPGVSLWDPNNILTIPCTWKWESGDSGTLFYQKGETIIFSQELDYGDGERMFSFVDGAGFFLGGIQNGLIPIPFQVVNGRVDLGEISKVFSGKVWGRIQLSSGQGAPLMKVRLIAPGTHQVGEVNTDPKGSFEFSGLGVGQYQLNVFPSRDSLAWYPIISQRVTVHPLSLEQEINIVLENPGFQVNCPNPLSGKAVAVVIDASGSVQSGSPSADGQFFCAKPTGNGTAAFIDWNDSRLVCLSKGFLNSDYSTSLAELGPSSASIEIVGVEGEYYSIAVLNNSGTELAKIGPLTSSEIQLTGNGSALSLCVHHRGVVSPAVNVEKILADGQLNTSVNDLSMECEVVDYRTGVALSGFAMVESANRRIQFTRGRVFLPRLISDLKIDIWCEGYWPDHIDGFRERIGMRRICGGLTVLANKPNQVSVRPIDPKILELGILQQGFNVSAGRNSLFSALPEGDYVLEYLDNDRKFREIRFNANPKGEAVIELK